MLNYLLIAMAFIAMSCCSQDKQKWNFIHNLRKNDLWKNSIFYDPVVVRDSNLLTKKEKILLNNYFTLWDRHSTKEYDWTYNYLDYTYWKRKDFIIYSSENALICVFEFRKYCLGRNFQRENWFLYDVHIGTEEQVEKQREAVIPIPYELD
jgi:hypothetical protein